MEYTTNLNLKKPDINEYYNIVEQENENADIIDEAIGKLNSDVGTEELTTEAQDCKGAINELNKNKIGFIDYTLFNDLILSNGKTGVFNAPITEKGYIYFVGLSNTNNVQPDVSIHINNLLVFQYRPEGSTTYAKMSSSFFPVDIGDNVRLTVESSFISQEVVRFVPLKK